MEGPWRVHGGVGWTLPLLHGPSVWKPRPGYQQAPAAIYDNYPLSHCSLAVKLVNDSFFHPPTQLELFPVYFCFYLSPVLLCFNATHISYLPSWTLSFGTWTLLCTNWDCLLYQIGPSVVPTWTICCTNLDPMLYQLGPSVVPTWTICCTNMDHLLYQLGPYVAPTWTICYTNLNPLFYELGPSLVATWNPCCTKLNALL